jgi:hypothetical protein
LARLFISHSSKDTVPAIAFKQWLGNNGWPEEDVFLDVEDIGGGERWKDALRKAHMRCEAVILLASPDALSSPECLTEVRKAEDFGKEIIVVLLRDLTGRRRPAAIVQGAADRRPLGAAAGPRRAGRVPRDKTAGSLQRRGVGKGQGLSVQAWHHAGMRS